MEKISLWLATKMAFYLFFRPIPFNTPKREVATLNKAKTVQAKVKNKPFTIYEWGDGAKQILVVHGWSGRATQFYPIIEKLLKEGFKIIGIDAPGHGANHEKTSNMLEFVEAVEEVQKLYGNFHTLIGHSLGGMALFNALDRYSISKNIIILGTPASVPFVVQDFCDKIGGSEKMAQRICDRISKDFETDLTEISTNYLALKNNPNGMVFHDEGDLDVGVENAKVIAEDWKNGTLHLTSGLGHRRILNDEVVVGKILNFIKEN